MKMKKTFSARDSQITGEGREAMNRRAFLLVFSILFLVLLTGGGLTASSAVHALFDLQIPATGPFPRDWFTVGDRSQNTRLRVNLPLPDCHERPSDCEDLNVINTLDGFNLQPRLSIPFDGPIDVNSVTSQDVFLINLGDNLGDTIDQQEHGDHVVGINQIVWDPPSHTLHVESDALLEQHTRYALIVTRGVQDLFGDPVEATESFRRFRETVRGEYRQALIDAIEAAREIGFRERDIVTASVFTTQSATAILEKIRDQIHATRAWQPADFLLGPGQTRTLFSLENVQGITWMRHTRVEPPGFTAVDLNLSLLQVIPGVVGQVAFGRYRSPDYMVHPGEYIPPVSTRTGTPVVQATKEVYFNLFLPSGPAPRGGWPVAIYGVEGGSNKNVSTLNVAASLAAQGVATITINNVGTGFGPLGTLPVTPHAGQPVTFSDGGRGFDQNGDNVIGPIEGSVAAPPRERLLFDRDAQRQNVADFMQLVRVLQVGMDIDGNGLRDLDPTRIY